jgi:class 3 adenylate cyclase
LNYKPKPINTDHVKLSEDMIELTEYLSKNTHEIWAKNREQEGWSFGNARDDNKKEHPCLIPYDALSNLEKDYDRNTALGTIKLILSLGYNIELPTDKLLKNKKIKKTHINLLRFLKSKNGDLEQILHLWHAHDPNSWQDNIELYIVFSERVIKLAEPLLAFDVLQEGLEFFPENLRLKELMGLTLARLGYFERANAMLFALYQTGGKKSTETLGMLGRTHKDLWNHAKTSQARKRHLTKSRKYYQESYNLEKSYWTGINIATTYALEGNLEKAKIVAQEINNLCLLDQKEGQEYWLFATLGEANLILGELDDSLYYYGQAVKIGHKNIGDINSTRKNARLLFDGLLISNKVREQIEFSLCVPKIIVFTGHMIDEPGRKRSRFPKDKEKIVYQEIFNFLKKQGPCIGFSSAAMGADILFIEAMEALNNKVTIVLPFCREQFEKESINIKGDKSWIARYRQIMNNNHEIIELTKQGTQYSDYYYQYGNNIMYGQARIKALQLETTLYPLAVWNKDDIGKSGGASSFIKKWLDQGHEVNIIDLKSLIEGSDTSNPLEVISKAPVKELDYYDDYQIKGILFADTVNYSRLQDHEFVAFEKVVFGIVKEMIESEKYQIATKNTWGDAIYIVFDKIKDTGLFALELNERISALTWRELGFSQNMKVRTAVHAGPVHCSINPVTGLIHFNGTNVCRAARIEPLTPPGQVYTSLEYASLAASEHIDEFSCVYIGQISMPKKYGIFPTYHLRRRS